MVIDLGSEVMRKMMETIKIVSHSKGAAFAAGYIKAWNKFRISEENKDQFAEDGGKVEFSLMLASHQGMDFSLDNAVGTNVNILHDYDDFLGLMSVEMC